MTIDSLLDKYLWPYISKDEKVYTFENAERSCVRTSGGGYDGKCIYFAPGLTEQEYEALAISLSAHIIYTPIYANRRYIPDCNYNSKELQALLERFRVISRYKLAHPEFTTEIINGARIMMNKDSPTEFVELREDAIHILMDETELVTKKSYPEIVDGMLNFKSNSKSFKNFTMKYRSVDREHSYSAKEIE